MGEFEKACRDFKIHIAPEFLPAVFDVFDVNHDGTLSIGEFMKVICGQLSDERHEVIARAYCAIDKQEKGFLTMREVRKYFKPSRHPDVTQSIRTAEQVHVEFLETFELHHNVYPNERTDGGITQEEFTDYYRTISFTIDSNEYFSLILESVWDLQPDKNHYQKF